DDEVVVPGAPPLPVEPGDAGGGDGRAPRGPAGPDGIGEGGRVGHGDRLVVPGDRVPPEVAALAPVDLVVAVGTVLGRPEAGVDGTDGEALHVAVPVAVDPAGVGVAAGGEGVPGRSGTGVGVDPQDLPAQAGEVLGGGADG